MVQGCINRVFCEQTQEGCALGFQERYCRRVEGVVLTQQPGIPVASCDVLTLPENFMRNTEKDVIDAEFRVISRSLWAGWMAQLPHKNDRIAFILCLAAPLTVIGAVLTGFPYLAFLFSSLLATAAALVSTEYKRFSILGGAVVALLATSGCSKELAAHAPERVVLASEEAEMPAEAQANIRAATKYRDPREGYTPKGIDIQGGQVKLQDDREVDHDGH